MLSVDSIGSWNEEKGNSETTKGKVNERTTIKKTSHLVTLIFPCVRIIAFNLGLPSIGLLPFYGLLRWHYFLFRIGGLLSNNFGPYYKQYLSNFGKPYFKKKT